MLASTTETSPEQHVDIGSRAARAWSGRQRRWGAGHTKQARNRSPSQMCGTPAVSIPVWLGTGSAQVGTDGIGPEANLANEATAGKARSCSPAFVGRRFCFPHRRPKEAREGTAQRPPSRERGRPTSWPSHPPLVLPLDDDESTEKIH